MSDALTNAYTSADAEDFDGAPLDEASAADDEDLESTGDDYVIDVPGDAADPADDDDLDPDDAP